MAALEGPLGRAPGQLHGHQAATVVAAGPARPGAQDEPGVLWVERQAVTGPWLLDRDRGQPAPVEASDAGVGGDQDVAALVLLEVADLGPDQAVVLVEVDQPLAVVAEDPGAVAPEPEGAVLGLEHGPDARVQGRHDRAQGAEFDRGAHAVSGLLDWPPAGGQQGS
ncbi:MAG: hypothetical protein P1V81_11770 [Planctomycetota bacterium]|nr:hypothetical protein [Planctomycetota bacterium]